MRVNESGVAHKLMRTSAIEVDGSQLPIFDEPALNSGIALEGIPGGQIGQNADKGTVCLLLETHFGVDAGHHLTRNRYKSYGANATYLISRVLLIERNICVESAIVIITLTLIVRIPIGNNGLFNVEVRNAKCAGNEILPEY